MTRYQTFLLDTLELLEELLLQAPGDSDLRDDVRTKRDEILERLDSIHPPTSSSISPVCLILCIQTPIHQSQSSQLFNLVVAALGLGLGLLIGPAMPADAADVSRKH